MNEKKRIVFQGTFDPFTNGHLAVVRAARAVFDEVIILLLVNPDKKPLFSLEKRKAMIEASVKDMPGVSVDHFDGLLVDYLKAHELSACVRGVRNSTDFDYEKQNHFLSQKLYPALQTLFLPSDPQWECVSSSAVKTACEQGTLPQEWSVAPLRLLKTIIHTGGKLPKEWVPEPVLRELKKTFPKLLVF